MGGVDLFWLLHQPKRRDWTALQSYIRTAPETEVWLFLRLLSGHYWYPAIPSEALIEWAAAYAGMPPSLLLLCAQEAGDTAEALTLTLIPPHRPPTAFSRNFIQWSIQQLPPLLSAQKRLPTTLTQLWDTLSQKEAFFLHKLLLHSAHLGALRQKRSSPLLSLLQLRWDLPPNTLLAHFRTQLEPPSSCLPLTLF